MPRTALTVIEARRTSTAITQTSTGAETEYKFALTGKEFVIIENNSGSSKTCTFNEVSGFLSNAAYADNDVATIADGAIKICGPFVNSARWKQSDGMLYFDFSAAHADLTVAVCRNPDNASEKDTK